jgi:hypothetical protein
VTRRVATVGRRRVRGRQRGQGLVEFAIFVPLFIVLLLAMLDFGFAFYTKLTLEYASREGARVGAALAAGSSTLPCAQVDNHVIAAVQRVLKSAGITVPLNNNGNTAKTGVNWIRIYKADADGNGYGAGSYNQWTYSAGGGPTVDGTTLDFVAGAPGWSACSRLNGSAPDAIGVAINYTYGWTTPLTSALRLISPGTPFFSYLTFLDKTVMNLNPTNP